MSSVLPYKAIEICKWCGRANSETIFEKVHLCNPCNKKAIHASQNPKLCLQCCKLLTEEHMIKDLFSEYGTDHSSANYLKASSADGCCLCRMLLLQDPNPDTARLQFGAVYLQAERPKSVSKDVGGDFPSAGDINLLSFSSEQGQFRLNLSVSAFPGMKPFIPGRSRSYSIDDPAARYVSQRPLEDNLGDENITRLVRDWLSECLDTHSESPHATMPQLPSRVVDVGNDSNPTVKLLETTLDMKAPYVTLSYCWGRPRFLTTLRDNLEKHKESLNFDLLPLTFKDAITTTRNLGFRYIWIDALCIIQDCNEDKAREIGKMGNIYNDSALTIGVVSAKTVAEGFLKTKPRQFTDIPYRTPEGKLGAVRITPQVESDLWDESLYTRAWCLQENLLSARLLLYTDTEVIWQCQTCPIRRPKTSHVAYSRENPELGRSPFNRLPPHILEARSDDGPKNLNKVADRFSIWSSLVENYTRRNLTVASDRLPALDGIVQKFRLAWNDTFVCGIWLQQLLPSLAWSRSVQAGQPHWPQLTEYRAPSWSWASIDGPVEFDGRFDLGNARGMGAQVASCINVSGAANEDAILIEAYMIPITSLPGQNTSSRGTFYLDDHADDGRWPLYADGVGDLDEEMKGIVQCLLLGEGSAGAGKMMKTTALVIMPASGQDSDTFTRIGFWSTTVKGSSRLWAGAANKRVVRII